jgi:hypothetical protein
MKFKTLFLSMLSAAALVSCNNDMISPSRGGEGAGGSNETTYATFFLKAGVGSTYAGTGEQDGTTGENYVGDAVLAIYDQATSTPEAVAYVSAVPQGTNSSTGSGGKVTLKCKTGSKTIYLAVNVGYSSNYPTIPTLVYAGTNATTENTDSAPGVSESYTGAEGTVFADTLNALLVADVGSPGFKNDFKNTALATTGTPTLPNVSANADSLIRALTSAAGSSGNGVFSGGGNTDSRYLMSNWKGNNDVGSSSYNSTANFTLVKVTAADSRTSTTPSSTSTSPVNAFNINVQRAVAKVGLNIATQVAGTGTNAGTIDFAKTTTSFAVGNLAKAVYPFQQFAGATVKSPAYECTEGIATTPHLLNQFKRFMDNSRVYAAYDITTYPHFKTTVDSVINTINAKPNIPFTTNSGTPPTYDATNYVVVTENNSNGSKNAYTTYVLFAVTYEPDDIITSALAGASDASAGRLGNKQQPQYPTGSSNTIADTLYYVKDPLYPELKEGKFFWNATQPVLRDYMQNVLGIAPGNIDAKIKDWSTPKDPEHAQLQKYYRGKCFYRIWIQDESNEMLVRRNHIYTVNVTAFSGPGIGDPHSIIDPNPASGPEELKASDTYVTATINVLKWHTVAQGATGGLN